MQGIIITYISLIFTIWIFQLRYFLDIPTINGDFHFRAGIQNGNSKNSQSYLA